jgi:hypothetical protein
MPVQRFSPCNDNLDRIGLRDGLAYIICITLALTIAWLRWYHAGKQLVGM